MSIPLKRKCDNCRFLADAGLAGNGWCTHPKRQVSSDVRILVRKGELACRNDWGSDLWESAADPTSRTTGSGARSVPLHVVLPTRQFDDQVQSVVNAGESQSAQHDPSSPDSSATIADDQVVAQGSVDVDERGARPASGAKRQSTDDVNHLAHAEQHERAQVIARGGAREAILRARERHRQRRGQPLRADEAPPIVNDPMAPGETGTGSAASPDEGVARPGAGGESGPPPEDRVLLTRQRSTPPAIDPIRRSYNDSTPPVPASELPPGAEALSGGGDERTRFDSVPQIRDDVVLPRRQPPAKRWAEPERRGLRAADEHVTSPDADAPGRRPFARGAEPSQNRQIRAAAKATRENRPNRQATRLSSQLDQRRRPISPESTRSSRDTDEAVPERERAAEQSFSQRQTRDVARETLINEGSSGGQAGSSADRTVPARDPNQPQGRPRSVSDVSRGRGRGEPAVSSPSPISADLSAELFRPSDDVLPGFEHEPDDDPLYEPVTVRRRSWLNSLSRRRQQGAPEVPPPVANFPLRAAAPSPPGREETDGKEGDAPAITREEFAGTPVQSALIDVHPPEPLASDAAPAAPLAEPNAAAPSVPVTPAAELHQALSLRSLRRPERANDEAVDDHVTDSTPVAMASSFIAHDDVTERSASLQVVRPPTPLRQPAASERAAGLYDMDALRARLFGGDPADPSPREAPRPPARIVETAPQQRRTAARIEESEDDEARDTRMLQPSQVERTTAPNLRSLVAREIETLDMSVQIAPGLPRVCRTCRDFRPAENEERGWCTNEWAFTHRRMVNAGDRPCQRSIGCWWLPDDTIWLQDDSLAAFDQPTPLMDAILAQHERRRVGER